MAASERSSSGLSGRISGPSFSSTSSFSGIILVLLAMNFHNRAAQSVSYGCSQIRSEARAAGRLFQQLLGLSEASSAANPPVAAFCGRAYGHGGWLPPSPVLSFRTVFRNGRGASFRGRGPHAAFLFNRAIDGPDGQGARPTGIRSCTMPTVPSESSRYLKFAPADRHLAANWEKRRIRYVAVFWQLIGRVSLACTHQYWCVGAKHNGSQPLYVLWHTLNSSMSCVVGCRRDDSTNQLQKL